MLELLNNVLILQKNNQKYTVIKVIFAVNYFSLSHNFFHIANYRIHRNYISFFFIIFFSVGHFWNTNNDWRKLKCFSFSTPCFCETWKTPGNIVFKQIYVKKKKIKGNLLSWNNDHRNKVDIVFVFKYPWQIHVYVFKVSKRYGNITMHRK